MPEHAHCSVTLEQKNSTSTIYIFQWQIQDFPLGGAPTCWGGGGANLRRVHFSAKPYVKMKEIDPVGGRARRGAPPGSANVFINLSYEPEGNLNLNYQNDLTLVLMRHNSNLTYY